MDTANQTTTLAMNAAYDILEQSIMYHNGNPIGTCESTSRC